MPNPLTNAPLASQTGTAPGANSMDTDRKTAESSFLSILNGLEPDVGSDQQEPVTEEPALDAEDLEEPAESEASAPETADIATPSLEGPTNQDTPRNNPEIQSSLAHFFSAKGAPSGEPLDDRGQANLPATHQHSGKTSSESSTGLQHLTNARVPGPPQQKSISATYDAPRIAGPIDRDGEARIPAPNASPHSTETPAAPETRPQTVVAHAVATQAAASAAETSSKSSTIFPDSEVPADGEAADVVPVATTRDSATGSNAAPFRTEVARAVAGQLAAAITARPSQGGFEIALNPEELGRVSILMGGRDDGLHLLITAERPETLDLMRRHISVLAAEFEKAGYGEMSFDLGLTGENKHDADKSSSEKAYDLSETEDPSDPAPPPYPTGSGAGLDLRL
ncbi:MAG: flagellar hook-length control protein FliK [Ruegeria sp.]